MIGRFCRAAAGPSLVGSMLDRRTRSETISSSRVARSAYLSNINHILLSSTLPAVKGSEMSIPHLLPGSHQGHVSILVSECKT